MIHPTDIGGVGAYVRPRHHPKKVSGPIRRVKWAVLIALLAIYWGAPWLRWDRGPYVPDQAFLIDLTHGKAYFLFFELWPQEVYIVTGVLVMMAVGLFMLTAVAGRVWCGFACPQTVWTDLFMLVERWIEGDRAARIRDDRTSMSIGKAARKLAKHATWILIALLTGGAWILYFNDAYEVSAALLAGQASSAVLLTILLLTLSTYVLAGWARENVCVFMCPYSRFQSAMLDADSLIVAYRTQRGEPRGKHRAGDSWEGRGHCIDCRQCVEVCPTGVDIRKGLQIDCIACGLCIDACNQIMTRVGLPTGLIGYDTLRGLRGETSKLRILRPRTIAYGLIYAAVGAGLLWLLLSRELLAATLIPARSPNFVLLSDGSIRNDYEVKLLNKSDYPMQVTADLAGLPRGQLHVGLTGVESNSFTLKPNNVGSIKVFVSVPRDVWRGVPIPYHLTFADGHGNAVTLDARLQGPEK